MASHYRREKEEEEGGRGKEEEGGRGEEEEGG